MNFAQARSTATELWYDISRTLRGKVGPILVFEVVYRVLLSVVYTPVTVWILTSLVGTRGKPSIGNFEIAAFLLSWPGIVSMILIGGLYVTQLYFQIAGLILIMRPGAGQVSLIGILRKLLSKFPRLYFLGLYQMAACVAILLPSALLTIGLLNYLWSDHDIYGLVILRPTIFWVGVGLGAILVSISGYFIGKFLLRWSLALPEQLLNDNPVSPLEAMRLSNERTRNHKPKIVVTLVFWFAFQSALSALVLGFLRWSADAFLDFVGLKLAVALPATVLVLVVHYVVITLLAIVGVTGFAAVILYLDRKYSPRPITPNDGTVTLTLWERSGRPSLFLRHPAFVTAVILAVVLPIGSLVTLNRIDVDDRMEIIAHRAGGALGPENTIAALKKAIDVGAQWAEIDVQFTQDKAIVVIHDMDLRRLGGLDKAVRGCTLAEIKAIDVGSHFGPQFKGERIPTLEEFLDAAKDKIHVLIELKTSGRDDGIALARGVVALLKRRNEVERHRICSQSYESLVEAKRLEPLIPVGFIAAQAIGPMQNLTVDFFMLSVELSTKRFIERARAVGKDVYSWTVKDPDLILPLLDRGSAAIITDDPQPIAQRLEEIRGLSTVERLILRARDALAD